MRCPRCQAENRQGARFCHECGASLGAVCASCNANVEAGSRFCDGCGTPLAPAATSRFSAPEVYTPKHLATKILGSRAALEGERKHVTVLFADLKSSMELLADRDPEDAWTLLDPVLERMMEAVHRYEGTVNHVLGDGIMALFGAPLAHEDHAVRACYAALRMQESVKQYAGGVLGTYGVPVRIRVGLNSGEVVVRSIGSDLRMDYTAVGQTTHMAARMEQIADPGSILATPETLNLAEGYIVVKSLGERSIKGLDAPTKVFEVVGARTVRSRLQAAAARGLTHFVGRDPELEQLRQALERAGMGYGQVVAVVGDPGVGKSRLFWELTHSPRTEGWLIVESGSVSYGKATAFLPLIELLRTYFQIEASEDPRKFREKVTGRLLSLDRALEPYLPALLWLLDAPVDDPHWQGLDPSQRRQQALDGIKRLLLRESQVQPLLLVLEDLHWIDAETQVLLDMVVDSLPAARLLLVVSYRPEYQHPWGSKTWYRQLRIDPLPAESAEELLKVLLGNDPGLRPLEQLLIERTEGNPLFLEESVRTLVETKVLAGERGAYQLVKASQTFQIPVTVQAIIAARIDRLAPEDKQLLQAASVLGRDVPFALLEAIAGESEQRLRQGLARLQAGAFLHEARLFPKLEYTFKHALTHEAAYAGLLYQRRRAVHAQIMDAIERLFADRPSEQIELLAHHAFRAEIWAKASDYLRQAGVKAAERSAYRQAANYFEQALESHRHLVSDQVSIEQTIELRFALRNALWPIGEFGRILPHLRDARDAAESLGDAARISRAYSYITQYHWMVGDYERAIEAGHRAIAIGAALGDLTVEVPTNLHVGLAHHARGDYRTAIQVLARNVGLLQEDLAREYFGLAALPAVYSRTWMAWSLAELGEFSEAISCGEQEVEIADAAGHPLSRVNASFGIGYAYLRQGALPRAIDTLEDGLKLCQSLTVPFWLPVATSLLGHAHAVSGQLAEAIPLLEEAVERAAVMARRVDQSLWSLHLSEAYMTAGRIQDARRLATSAVTLARRHGERGNEAHALRIYAEIASRSEPTENVTSEDSYRTAAAIAMELGMRPLVAHCHLGLAKHYRRTGKRDQAKEHLIVATMMYREMDMRFWLEKAEAEMGWSPS